MNPSFYQDKEVLVTGGCGWIGSELVRQLLGLGVRVVKVFDNNEQGHFHLQRTLPSKKIRHLIGDVRSKQRLDFAMKNVDIVFHAAALKHVSLCEYNPFEALQTNVIGTQNVLDSVRDHTVSHFVFISTDKAVNPVNTMGATKLLAEKLTLTADLGHTKTKFACVRFSNVLGSSGSIIPLFKKQIAAGGPLTLTSSRMTRFCMSLSDAVSLILRVPPIMAGKETFILKMNAVRIKDLAEVLIQEYAPRCGHQPHSIMLKEIGVRPGEKLYETLVTNEEISSLRILQDMFVVSSGTNVPHLIDVAAQHEHTLSYPSFCSEHAPLLTREEICSLLHKEQLLE